MKEDKGFQEWECRTFGAGYGTGEMPIIRAIKTFFDNLENGRSYDYEKLEKALGNTVTWLLINALDRGSVIEWGTSARYGWLTCSGEMLKTYMDKKTVDELYEICMLKNNICLCDGEMKEKGHEECGKNPFVFEKVADEIKYKK
jgi:hypothetical protein